MKTKTPSVTARITTELFDFAKLIGAHVEFSGSYDPENGYINAYLAKDYQHIEVNEGTCLRRSVFGRSESEFFGPDLDEALRLLAAALSGEKITCGKEEYNVPQLKHTKGYRG